MSAAARWSLLHLWNPKRALPRAKVRSRWTCCCGFVRKRSANLLTLSGLMSSFVIAMRPCQIQLQHRCQLSRHSIHLPWQLPFQPRLDLKRLTWSPKEMIQRRCFPHLWRGALVIRKLRKSRSNKNSRLQFKLLWRMCSLRSCCRNAQHLCRRKPPLSNRPLKRFKSNLRSTRSSQAQKKNMKSFRQLRRRRSQQLQRNPTRNAHRKRCSTLMSAERVTALGRSRMERWNPSWRQPATTLAQARKHILKQRRRSSKCMKIAVKQNSSAAMRRGRPQR
mmetsp:Transcript_21552/g.50242  ORF Transcript_21552/g.50242 Transcript_21552/m.50242 type:complete len:277 (+) Transcript_21552:776-1606(+)